MAEQITYTAKLVKVHRIRRFTKQPRTYFDPAEIAARAGSMKSAGQQTPVTVEKVTGDPDHDYELIDGESRWLSAQKAGLRDLMVIIRSQPFKNVFEKHLASLVANFNRSEHTPMEISNALQVQVKAGKTQQELSQMLGRHQMWVSLYLSLQNLHPELQALLDPRVSRKTRVSPATGFSLAVAPKDRQLEIYKAATRSDGKVTKSRVEHALKGVIERKNRKRTESPAKRKESLENALRSLGSGFGKIRNASRQEAQVIFAELKSAGEIPELHSLEDLLKLVGVPTAQDAFPDLPLAPEDPTPNQLVIHREALENYWLKKAGTGNPDRYLLEIAYPQGKGLPRFIGTKWHHKALR